MDYKGTTNANPVNDIQQNIKPGLNERQYLSETER